MIDQGTIVKIEGNGVMLWCEGWGSSISVAVAEAAAAA